MTTKKALVIVGVLLAGIGLLVALFVAGIAGVVFYTIGNSDAAETAKKFLRTNEKLKQDIGEVRDFGFFVTGNIKTQNSAGNAELGLKAEGARRSVNTTVVMVYRAGREWRVVEAYYDTDEGERVYLTRNFEEESAAGEGGLTGGGAQGIGEGAGEGAEGSGAGAEEGGADAEGSGASGGGGAQPGGFDEEGFAAEVLGSPGPVLVVVGSPSSLDSVELDKTLEQIAPEYERAVGLVRYDLSERPAVLRRLNVEAVPTVILYKGGGERERLAGKIARQELTQLIGRHIEP